MFSFLPCQYLSRDTIDLSASEASAKMSDDEKRVSLDPEVEKNLPVALADAIRKGSVSEDILKHSHDADEALQAFASHQGEVIELDAATNKRLLRKIDFHLIPVSMSPLSYG